MHGTKTPSEPGCPRPQRAGPSPAPVSPAPSEPDSMNADPEYREAQIAAAGLKIARHREGRP